MIGSNILSPKRIRWILPLSLLLALVGYFGPWIAHQVAGLVVTGLDFGEYVKFLPTVRDGTVKLWREGFYIPLITVSAAAILIAYRAALAYPWWLRYLLLAIAAIAALNLVPPAWTPTRLLEPEFRLQTASLVLLLIGVGLSPFIALLPARYAAIIISILGLAAIIAPTQGFFAVLPAIQYLYNEPLLAGWGLWLMLISLIILIISFWHIPQKPASATQLSRK